MDFNAEDWPKVIRVPRRPDKDEEEKARDQQATQHVTMPSERESQA